MPNAHLTPAKLRPSSPVLPPLHVLQYFRPPEAAADSEPISPRTPSTVAPCPLAAADIVPNAHLTPAKLRPSSKLAIQIVQHGQAQQPLLQTRKSPQLHQGCLFLAAGLLPSSPCAGDAPRQQRSKPDLAWSAVAQRLSCRTFSLHF